jgi:hypothetical protein
MKRAVIRIGVILLVFFCAGVGFSQDSMPELDALVEQWTQALNAEDIDGFLSCYWPDAIRITYFPGSEPEITEGMGELRAAQEAGLEQVDLVSMNLIYDDPVRFFPRNGRPTYVYPNSRFGFMDMFEFEERRGEFRIITQYLLPHPAVE